LQINPSTGAFGIGTVIDVIPYDTLNSGTLSFEGSAGQLFSITNNLTSGSIFSVNDVSGIPSIDVNADGTIQLAPYGTNEKVGIGTTNPQEKLDLVGNLKISGGISVGGTTGTSGQVLKSTGTGLEWGTGGGGVTAWSRKTTTYTAVTGDRLIADTSGGAFTITLPATPTTGNSVVFADGADWFTNNLTVARNSSTIEGVADDFVLDIKGIEVEFVYDGTTWEVFAYTGPAGPNDVIYTQNDTTSTTLYPVMVSGAGINTTPKVTTTTNYLSFNATTGQITAIDFNSASDRGLKTDVTKINNSIEILKQLSPVSFNWTTTGEKSYGLIAQEVEKILPELVSETNNVKSVRYIPLIAMLIDAIVELDKRISND
jgi:hypothetical protein